MKKITLNAISLFAGKFCSKCLGVILCLFITLNTYAGNVLIYGPLQYGFTISEQSIAIGLGHTVTVVTAAQWQSMTTAQFAAYDAIIIPEHGFSSQHSGNLDPDLIILNNTKEVWSPAITGKRVYICYDPLVDGGPLNTTKVTNAISSVVTFGGTGLYFASSLLFWFNPSPPNSDNINFLSLVDSINVQGGACLEAHFTYHPPYFQELDSCSVGNVQIIASLPIFQLSPFNSNYYCSGNNVNINFQNNQVTFLSGNVFTAQLSDATGNFTNPTILGTLTGTASGSIPVTIPGGVPPGNGYRVRVVATLPADTTNTSSSLLINVLQDWYLDFDGDHYTTGAPTNQCNNPGAGYITSGILGYSDYDDNNPLIHATPANILMYGPLVTYQTYNEKTIAEAQGHTVTVVDATQWQGMTTAQFAAYDAIVIPERYFQSDNTQNADADLTILNNTKSVWSPAISGKRVYISYDPILDGGTNGTTRVTNAINAVANSGGTGLYYPTCLTFWHAAANTNINFLSLVDSINVHGNTNCLENKFDYYPLGFTIVDTCTDGSALVIQSPKGIFVKALSSNYYCDGNTFNLGFNSSEYTFNSGNIFTAQLSDATGSFASPVDIGSLTSTTASPIPVTIPNGTPTGSGYRIRIISSSPLATGSPSVGFNINVNRNWYIDADGDHYYSSAPLSFVVSCNSPGINYTTAAMLGGGDCNDNDPAIHPGVLEITGNSIDENCNGLTDENNAMNFDGVNDWVEVPYNVSAYSTHVITMSAWIKRDVGGVYQSIIYKNSGYALYVNANNQLEYFHFLGYASAPAAGYVPVGKWVYVSAVIINHTSATFYINGINVGSTTDYYQTTVEDFGSPNYLYIGSNFKGSIDDVSIWNTARTQAEIQADYCSVYPGTPGLLLNYNFNQGIPNGNNPSETIVKDNSGNHRDGTTHLMDLTGTTSNWVPSYEFFEDLDGDGYGSTVPTTCSITASTVNTDCNVNNGAIHPGPEILGNNIDDNCNGIIDESTALNFTGAYNPQTNGGDFIRFDNNGPLTLDNSFSIETWVYLNDDNGAIFSSLNYMLLVNYLSYGLTLYNYNTNTWVYSYNNPKIALNTWTHVAVTYNSTTNEVKFFINALQGSMEHVLWTASNPPPTNVFMGYAMHYPNTILNGSLSSTRIWNRVLAPCEILTNMNCQITTPQTGLIANFNYNEGLPNDNNQGINNIIDISGNNNNGTLLYFSKFGNTSNWTIGPVLSCAPVTATFYVDNDGDGYGSNVVAPCSINAASNNNDCDDTDPLAHLATDIWYLDADHDHYYTGSGIVSCHSPGPNYTTWDALNGGDCDDLDPLVQYEVDWYLDADADGYYTGSPITSCHSPAAGYTSDYPIHGGGDCDDANASVYPGAPEVLANGIDNNCNGYIDEIYCIPLIDIPCNSNFYHSFIGNVTLGTINNNSDCNDYTDYSTTLPPITTTALAGSTINFSISEGSYYGDEGVSIYIDYNNDGDFDDVDEQVANFVHMSQYYSIYATGTFDIPANQPPGKYRVRVISDNIYSGPSDPCHTSSGEAEDYTLIVVPHIYCTPVIDYPCSGVYISNVVLGSINNSSACSGYTDYSALQSTTSFQGETVNFTVSEAIYYVSMASIFIDYNDDGDFDDVDELVAANVYMYPDATGSFVIPASQPTGNYRVRIVSDYYGVDPPDPCYSSAGDIEDYTLKIICKPIVVDPCNTAWISNVTLGTINNPTSCNSLNNGYDDYTSLFSTTVVPGATVNYSVSAGGYNDEGVSIYVDYNNDGDFNDAGEQVAGFTEINSYDPLDANGSFIIPATLSLGNYRVRVISEIYSYGSADPCSSYSGEAEDYILTVVGCLNPTAWYYDGDGDGYYVGIATTTIACNPPGLHYISNPLGSNDCDDNDNTVWQSAFLYYDGDDDSYTIAGATTFYGATIPLHYLLTGNGNDCNDADNTKWQSGLFYIDADGDGLNVGQTSVCYGATIPVGYSTTTTGIDCDDTDPFNLTNGATLPLSEGFEGVNDPPLGWRNIDNGTQGKAWAKTSGAGGFGLPAHSMMFDNYTYNVIGQKDELQTRRLSFSGLSSVTLTFDLAYRVYIGFSDSLIVRVSTDCGVSFTRVYAKGRTGLSTADSCSCSFTPTPLQWRTETVDLTAFVGQPSIIIQFQNINGFGNKLYIDNVNVTGVAGGCIPPTIPTINATSTTNCETQSTTLSINTGSLNDATNWKWYSGSCNGTTVGSGLSINVSPSSTTTYFVRGEGGCVTAGSCASKTITVNAPVNYYLDVDGDGFGVTSDFQMLCGVSGNYRATVGGDCNDNNINVHPGASEICNGIDDNCNGQIDETCCSINLSGAITTVKCKGFNTGAINVSSSNIYGSPTYLWNNNSGSEDISNLFSGTYTVTVTYFAGCSSSASFNVSQPATVLAINLSKVTIRCAGKSTGQITALPTGGVLPYSYLWNTGQTTANITGLPASNYTVTVTDFAGCVKSKTTAMVQNPAMLVVITPSQGFATAQVNGGVPPYGYYWNTSPNQTTETATGLLSSHTYRVKVSDSKGCTKITTVEMLSSRTQQLADQCCEMQISVFPNPTNDITNVSISNIEKQRMNLKLFDATGRIVFEKMLDVDVGANNFSFDFGVYSKGIYNIVVQSDMDRKQIKLVIE